MMSRADLLEPEPLPPAGVVHIISLIAGLRSLLIEERFCRVQQGSLH